MVKRFAFVAVLLAAALPAFAHAADRGEAKATVAGKAVAIEYGRPMLKGRDMLGQAEVGKPWRMGADAATTLKTEADLRFGDIAVPKGDYVLTATKVAEGQWQLNVQNASDKASVASVPLVAQKLGDSVEAFTIELEGKGSAGDLQLKWGTTALRATFTGR